MIAWHVPIVKRRVLLQGLLAGQDTLPQRAIVLRQYLLDLISCPCMALVKVADDIAAPEN